LRNAFIQELVTLARQHPQIALIVGDLGYSVIEPFADEFPDRFINAGVAEQNMTGLAAGMASEGYHVFTYSIANFPTFRCAEQIRNDIDYHGLAVTTVAVGGGLAYGGLGYSHHAVQDYALLRIFPNMLIAAPGDQFEVRACLRYLVNNPQPSYLRLGKTGEVQIHTDIPYLEPGRWLPIRNNKDHRKILLSTGAALQLALAWQEQPNYQDFAVFSLPLWSMRAKTIQPAQLADCEAVVTLEDHLTDGGFGSWLLESSNMKAGSLNKIEIKALSSNVCGMVASQVELNRLGGIVPSIKPNY
jgi:transketolase